MFNFLYQYGQAVTVERRREEVYLPSDVGPTIEWFPVLVAVTVDTVSIEIARWEDDGGR